MKKFIESQSNQNPLTRMFHRGKDNKRINPLHGEIFQRHIQNSVKHLR